MKAERLKALKEMRMTNDDLIEALITDAEETMALLRHSELSRQAVATIAIGLAELAFSLTEQLDAQLSNVCALRATVKELQAMIHEDAKQTRVVTVVRKPIVYPHH